ncbi:MAG: hypothetical protein ACHQ2Z_17240, partial [Elusimicrobiota bacterium]
WEGGFCAGLEAKTLAIRDFGTGGGFGAWKRAAGEALKMDVGENVSPPADGLPWLSLVWDAAADRPLRVGPGAVILKPAPYEARAIADAALAKILADFDALCPIRDLVFQFSSADPRKSQPLPAWSLRLKTPLPWPLFVRVDMAAPFAAESSQLSFFVLNRRVTELEFEGKKLWAYFRE